MFKKKKSKTPMQDEVIAQAKNRAHSAIQARVASRSTAEEISDGKRAEAHRKAQRRLKKTAGPSDPSRKDFAHRGGKRGSPNPMDANVGEGYPKGGVSGTVYSMNRRPTKARGADKELKNRLQEFDYKVSNLKRAQERAKKNLQETEKKLAAAKAAKAAKKKTSAKRTTSKGGSRGKGKKK
jgi:hypothetical protein